MPPDLDDDNQPLEPAELLTEILMALVEHPDQVQVEETPLDSAIALVVHCAPTDRGIVIGRKGCNIEALRVIFNHMAAKQRRRITIEVANSRPERATVTKDVRRAS